LSLSEEELLKCHCSNSFTAAIIIALVIKGLVYIWFKCVPMWGPHNLDLCVCVRTTQNSLRVSHLSIISNPRILQSNIGFISLCREHIRVSVDQINN